jgi:hypothetical protein
MTPDMCDASVIGFVLPLEEQQQHAVLVAVSNIYIFSRNVGIPI